MMTTETKLNYAKQITDQVLSNRKATRLDGYRMWEALKGRIESHLDPETLEKLDTIHYSLGGKN